MLAAAPAAAVRYAVMVCTAVTTICGVWLAYGEPPNLIMKANLSPAPGQRLLPAATARRSRSPAISSSPGSCAAARAASASISTNMDVIDANAEDVRFLQATRHGEVLTPVELIEGHAGELGGRARRRHRAPAQRRVARPRAGPRRRAVEPLGDCCSGTSSATNWPTVSIATTCYDAAGRLRGGASGRAGGRRSARVDGAASAGARRRSAAFALVPFIAHARSCTASTTRCRCFWRRSPASSPRCPASRASRRCARSRCARPGRSTPSTTSCSRCFCRSRC